MQLPPVPPLPPGCPWADWAPPNIKWCEENLCAWITAPANTYSNLAYFLVAWLLWRRARDREPGGLLALYPAACAFLGAASAAFHASYTLFFQFFDYLGMFVILALFIVLNLQRQGWLPARRVRVVYVACVAVLSGSIPALRAIGFPYQLLIAALAIAVIVQEVVLRRTGRAAPAYGWFAAALVSLFAAAGCAALDITGCWCDPTDHLLQGHAFWHLFSAVSLYSAYHFFERIASGRAPLLE